MKFLVIFFLFTSIFSRKPLKIGTSIPLLANHIGPTSVNPHETYRYYDYPFCKPEEPKYKFPSIGEALQGMELVETLIDIRYRENVEGKKEICSKKIKVDELEKFQLAIKREYWYQFLFDDLPIYSLIGKHDPVTGRSYIYTHRHFVLGYNTENDIVEVNLEPRNPTVLLEGKSITFTYGVEWVERDISYSRRYERYLDNKFFEHQIHWFSIINSFLMVLFLSGLMVMVVVRTVRADLKEMEDFNDKLDNLEKSGVNQKDEEKKGKGREAPIKKLLKPLADFDNLLSGSFKETGWKKLSGDVFRPPRFIGVLSALIGTGVQLTLLVLFMIFIAIIFTFYDEPGTLMTTFLVFYVLTSIISGFISGSIYLLYKGGHWIRVMIFTSVFFPVIMCGCYGIMNAFAIMYSSSQVIPFKTIFLIFCIHFFLTTPLVCIGTILGRSNIFKNFFFFDKEFPPTKLLKRQIPPKPFYANRFIIVLMGGILPFGSIFIELYFIFSSFQTYKIYYVYGFFLVVFVILVIVTVCVSVVLTYVLLISEDWRWSWTSFFSAASTGFYTFCYAFLFYQNTKMSGLFEFIYYISHCLLFSATVSLICGSVGYVSSYVFVRYIYKGGKYD